MAVLVFGMGCKAQITTLPLYSSEDYEDGVDIYYKDTFNDFDNYTGTWEYVNGTTSLRIVFEKKLLYHDAFDNNYRDLLIGEYRYIENGVEKINTLPLLTNPPLDLIEHTIVGSSIIGNDNFPICSDCSNGQKRVVLSFEDPLRNNVEGLFGNLIVRRVGAGSVQQIKIELRQRGNILVIDNIPPLYSSFNVPWGEYTLTKVQ